MLASIGPDPIPRDDAVRAAARHLGFRRTGSDIKDAFESAINGAIRRGQLAAEGNEIRRS